MSRWFGRRKSSDVGVYSGEHSGENERLSRSGPVPAAHPDSPGSDHPITAAAEALEEASELLASGLPAEPDERTRAGLLQVGSNLSSAMQALSPYRTSADARLRAAYSAVHEAITNLAAVYAWLTFGRRRGERIEAARERRRRKRSGQTPE